jgi:hypothetical protein
MNFIGTSTPFRLVDNGRDWMAPPNPDREFDRRIMATAAS